MGGTNRKTPNMESTLTTEQMKMVIEKMYNYIRRWRPKPPKTFTPNPNGRTKFYYCWGPCTHGYENNRTPSVISKPQSLTSTTDSSRASIENYDPDLIHHYTMHKKTSTPLSVSTLMSPHQLNGGHHRVSPF